MSTKSPKKKENIIATNLKQSKTKKPETAVSAMAAPKKVLGKRGRPPKTAQTADKNTTKAKRPKLDEKPTVWAKMAQVMGALRAHDDAWPFYSEITDDIAPGYSQIIRRPMEMDTIDQKAQGLPCHSLVDSFGSFFFHLCEFFQIFLRAL